MQDLFYGALFVLLLIWLSSATTIDDSDAVTGKRSGVRIHTDYLTGAQYLGTVGGGLTPRLDGNGKQIIRLDLKNEPQK